jgi:hypothetical protein
LLPALLSGCGGQAGQEPAARSISPIFITRGIVRPAPLPAGVADVLNEDATVVGIVVQGRARAYTLQGMSPMACHVIDDVVGRSPVSVTYCPRTGCVRAFTGEGKAPLPIKSGGYKDGLLLFCGGDLFEQETGKSISNGKAFPFQRLPFEQTTWGEWKKSHPDTDVCGGG